MKKILFIRSDRFGEFLLSLYAVKLTRLNYPNSIIYMLAGKENIELTKDVDFIDYFLEYKEDVFRGYKGSWRLGRLLRKERIDCVVILNPKKEFHLASFLAQVPLRVGYNRKWGFCLNKRIEDAKYLCKKHEAEYNIDLVSLICKDTFVPHLELPVEPLESLGFLGRELSLNDKYIVIHPFSSHSLKEIEREFWQRLIKRIKGKTRLKPVIVGAKDDKEESIEIQKDFDVLNLVGKLTLRNLAAFLSHCCSVFIGLDSGPMHLASMLKKPVVGLFRASNPTRWGPFATRALVLEGKNINDFLSKIDNIVDFITLTGC